MRRLADGRVVHMKVAADGANDHLARVQADTDPDRYTLDPADTLGISFDRLLHAERRVARAHGVVLVGQRRAEERHDSVAHHLVDRALVPMDGLHHPLKNGIENLASLLRITVGEQFHRALEVGEEHGDLLPLPLQGALGRENLLGEVLRSVGLRRRARGGARAADGRRALEADLCHGGKLCAAARAPESQRGRALQAELRLGRVLLLAPGTLHLTLASQVGGGRDGGTKLALEHNRGQQPPGFRLGARVSDRPLISNRQTPIRGSYLSKSKRQGLHLRENAARTERRYVTSTDQLRCLRARAMLLEIALQLRSRKWLSALSVRRCGLAEISSAYVRTFARRPICFSARAIHRSRRSGRCLMKIAAIDSGDCLDDPARLNKWLSSVRTSLTARHSVSDLNVGSGPRRSRGRIGCRRK